MGNEDRGKAIDLMRFEVYGHFVQLSISGELGDNDFLDTLHTTVMQKETAAAKKNVHAI